MSGKRPCLLKQAWKPGFLHRVMAELAGGARMSLEGDLSACRFDGPSVLASDEAGVLKRKTSSPKLDFVALRLEPETVAPIFEQVMAAGVTRGIVHVEIERDGQVELGAYDDFHRDCVFTGPRIPRELLDEVQARGVVRSIEQADGAAR